MFERLTKLISGANIAGATAAAKPTTTDIAREVIAGNWGSGDKRIAALKKAGYNPDVIQAEVNRLLCCRELIIQNIKAWATKIANTHKYKYIFWNEPYGHECAVCHPHDGKNKGWQCIGWTMACWHHGGLPIPCNCGVIDNSTGERIYKAKTDAEALKIAQDHLKLKDIQVIRNKGKVIPKEWAQPGDMALLFVNGDEFQHMFLIMSDKYISDSTQAGGFNGDISATRGFKGRYVSGLKVLIRYTGKGFTTPAKKSIDELAHEVIDGKWGSGDSRKKALTECKYDYDAIQKRVNEILNPPKPTPAKKTVDELAKEVLAGKWGSGETRKKKLTAAGYDYDAVQKRVNEILTPPISSTVSKMNAWAKKMAAEKYHYVRWSESDIKTHTCPVCNGRKYNDHYGWNCIGWAFAIWHHGGGLKTNCNCHVIADAIKILNAKTYKQAYDLAVKYIGIKELEIIRDNGKSIKNQLKPGDICWTMSGGKINHTYYYMGNGKYSDSTSGRTDNIKADITASASLLNNTVLAIRYIDKNSSQSKKTVEELAREVIAGIWGSGDERKKKLVAAGYNYDAVQRKVNELI